MSRSEILTQSKDPFDLMQGQTLQGILSTVVREIPRQARQLVELKGILRLRLVFALVAQRPILAQDDRVLG